MIMSTRRPSFLCLVFLVILGASQNVLAGDFVDTRITFIFSDDNLLAGPGETLINSPTPDFGPRENNFFPFENLDTRDSGQETLSHLVLYRALPGFSDRLLTEASLVVRFSLFGEGDVSFGDDGSYLRLTYGLGGAVVQFVGFMAGWNYPGVLHPVVGGIVGSLVATYFTFLPCFLFIFLGGPYIEKFRGNQKLSSALSSITAAVVGVVLNLAVWFGMHVLFSGKAGFNWFGAAVGLASFIAIQWKHVGIVTIILCSGGLGLVWRLIGLWPK